jgi:hypothetical protein
MGSKLAMVLVVGVACGIVGSAVASTDTRSARDACALITQAQVTSAAGAAVGTGQPIGKTGCQWSTDSKVKTGRMMITLSIWDENKYFSHKPTPGITQKAVAGIGDDAYFATLGDLVSLFVKKGKATLDIRVYGLHDTAKQEQIESSLAKDALASW